MTCCALRRSKSNASGDAALGRSSHHSRRQLRDRADHEDPASALAPKLTFVMFFSGWLFWAFAQHRSASASGLRRPYRIIYSIFQRFNLEWKTRTLNLFTQAA